MGTGFLDTPQVRQACNLFYSASCTPRTTLSFVKHLHVAGRNWCGRLSQSYQSASGCVGQPRG